MEIVRPINDPTPNVTGVYSNKHRGTDYGYPNGTPVYAAAAGRVLYAVNEYKTSWINNGQLTTKDYGNFIKIEHGDRYTSIYAHLKKDSLLVKPGDFVNRGQKIAEVNHTGNSTGQHLHFEIRLDEKAVNPWNIMNRDFVWYYDN